MHFSEKFKFIMRLYNSRVRRGGATASAHTYLYIAKRAKIHDHLCVRCNLHSSTKHYSTHNNNNNIGGGGYGVGGGGGGGSSNTSQALMRRSIIQILPSKQQLEHIRAVSALENNRWQCSRTRVTLQLLLLSSSRLLLNHIGLIVDSVRA